MTYKLPGDVNPPITREEVQTFIEALRYGMKVSHKPEFLIALAEGWLHNDAVHREIMRPTEARKDALEECPHNWVLSNVTKDGRDWFCVMCEETVRRFDDEKPPQ